MTPAALRNFAAWVFGGERKYVGPCGLVPRYTSLVFDDDSDDNNNNNGDEMSWGREKVHEEQRSGH